MLIPNLQNREKDAGTRAPSQAADGLVSTPPAAAPILSHPTGMLDENRRKARYGVAYVRSVCSEAGVPMSETSPDEDVYAIDAHVRFPELDVPLQVKCTSKLTVTGVSASIASDPAWLQKWRMSLLPVYLVLVIVPKRAAWLRHDKGGTWHATAAFWVRVTGHETGRIQVPKKQRLTRLTFDAWRAETLSHYRGTP